MSGQPSRIIGVCLTGVALLYILISAIGLGWGLPSSSHNRLLFNDNEPPPGVFSLDVAGGARHDAQTAADVDVNPLGPLTGAILLNETDRQQAEIYRRFQLFTRQPDEMITMMALSGMSPHQWRFDPKLYQYGGLFIYPVGGLIRACGALGVFPVRGDLDHYLQRPDDFGRFYLVGRLYSCAWGAVGLFLVFALGRRMGGSAAGLIAALLYVLLPVVVCMSHEAKPHLPGAVLMLAAVYFGIRALERNRRRDWAALFVSCGAAVGIVLSSVPILLLIPVIAALHTRRHPQPQTAQEHGAQPAQSDATPRPLNLFLRATLGGWAVAGVVYFLTNPYVIINLFVNREVLTSNFGNSLAMYEVSRIAQGSVRVWQLTVAGATLPVTIGGLLALVVVVRQRKGAVLPLIVPAAVFAFQFMLIGAGKPDEYGRFGVFYECALAVGCAAMLAALLRRSPAAGRILIITVCAWCAACTGGYLWSFHADATGRGSQDLAADYLREHIATQPCALVAEPAPYSCPPLDFSRQAMVLYRRRPDGDEKPIDRLQCWNDAARDATSSNGISPPRFLVAALDDPQQDLRRIPSPTWDTCEVFESRVWPLPRSTISWANKPIVVLSRSSE